MCHGSTKLNFSILIRRQWFNVKQVIFEQVTSGFGDQEPYVFGLSGFVRK